MHEHSGARIAPVSLGDIGIPPHDAPMDFSGWFGVTLMAMVLHLSDARPIRPGSAASHRPWSRCGLTVTIPIPLANPQNVAGGLQVVTDEWMY